MERGIAKSGRLVGARGRNRTRRDSAGTLRTLANVEPQLLEYNEEIADRLDYAGQRGYDEGYAAALAWVQDELETTRNKFEAEYDNRRIPF